MSLTYWRRTLAFRSIGSVVLTSTLWSSLGVAALSRGNAPAAQESPRDPIDQGAGESTTVPVALPPTYGPAEDPPSEPAPNVLPMRIAPSAVRVLDADGNPQPLDASSLFDGEVSDPFVSPGDGPVRIEVNLSSPKPVLGVTLFGAAEGGLSIFAESDGKLVPLTKAEAKALSKQGERWHRFFAEEPVVSGRLVLEWTPSQAGARGPREIGLWALGAPAMALSGETLADRLQSEIPENAMLAQATPSRMFVDRMIATREVNSFSVNLATEPATFERAFLMYELYGVPHWTQVARSLNGAPMQGGLTAAQGDAHLRGDKGKVLGGLQVEEISPQWLRRGTNTVRFAPIEDVTSAGYEIRGLRIVGVGSGGVSSVAVRRPLIAPPNSVKADPATNSRRQVHVGFERPSQPHELVFRLERKADGVLIAKSSTEPVSGRGAKGKALSRSAQRLTVQLSGLEPGWHRVPFDSALGAGPGVDIEVRGGREVGATVSAAYVTVSPQPTSTARGELALSYPLHGECIAGGAHLRGFAPSDARLTVNGEDASTALSSDGAFGVRIPEPVGNQGDWLARLRIDLPSGESTTREVVMSPCLAAPEVLVDLHGAPTKKGVSEDEGAPYGAVVHAESDTKVAFGGTTLEIPKGAVAKDLRVTIRPVAAENAEPLPPSMVNVMPGKHVMRFGPHGMVFQKPVKLVLPFDSLSLPPGTSPSDIHGFYFDEQQHRWLEVGRIAEGAAGELVVVTEHFTDFVAATIAMPDAAGPTSFNPHQMRGMKAADPTAGLSLIQPPQAGPTGAANLQLPIDVPPGRNGIQPNLALAYNSEMSNGWLGVGWDLRLSGIEIDTRLGAAKYDGTDTYVMDGEALTPDPSLGANGFRRRVEGSFDRIERQGTGPTDYSWVITDKRGTKYTYGQSPDARLADPSVDPKHQGRIFRWYLERVEDTFGNVMTVTYQRDHDTAEEPFEELYLQRIDYTSHTSSALALAAAYHVDFELEKSGATLLSRPDTVSTGRPGFRELMRRRLKNIDVYFGTELVRRYGLEYITGDFGKSLLHSVALQGGSGPTELYRHTFDYYAVEKEGGKPRVFGNSVVWGDALQSDGGLSRSHDSIGGGSGSIGVGIGPVSLTASGGGFGGEETVSLLSLDLTGDGLLDQVKAGGSARFGRLYRPVTDPATGWLEPGSVASGVIGDKSLGHSTSSGWNASGDLGLAIFSGSANYARTSSDDDTAIADIDGDGLADLVRIVDGQVWYRRNLDGTRFGAEVAGGTLDASSVGLGASERLLQQAASAKGFFVDPLVRWVAPHAGNVTLTGGIVKAGSQGDGVTVEIYRTRGQSLPRTTELLWQRVFDAADTHACVPLPGNLCCVPTPTSPCASGLPIVGVEAGDRIYTKISPVGTGGTSASVLDDTVSWNPTITYDVGAGSTLREPFGAPIYRYELINDLRAAGGPATPWVAIADGTARIVGGFSKEATSDGVTVKVVHTNAAGTVVDQSSVSYGADAAAVADLGIAWSVQRGHNISFEVSSDSPIDPGLIHWAPVVHYDEFCRAVTTGGTYCGAPTCVPGEGCTLSGDPDPGLRIPGEFIEQSAQVRYPVVQYAASGPGDTDFTQTATADETCTYEVAGTVQQFGSDPVRLLVQGVNKLYEKQTLGAGAVVSLNLSVPVQVHDQFFVTSIGPAGSGATGTVTLTPSASCSASAPVKTLGINVRSVDSSFGTSDVMTGGYHRWFFGDWKDGVAFEDQKVTMADPPPDDAAFFYAVPRMVSESGGYQPIWLLRGIDGHISPSAQKPAIQGAGGSIPTGATGGLAALRSGANWNADASASAIVGAGVNIGRSTTQLELMDVNGDGKADSVSVDGVRLGIGNGSFGTKIALDFGFDDLRRIEHRSALLSVGASKLVTKVDSRGRPRGLAAMNVGAGVNYGVSATHVDLIDINGDGLVDHVFKDPTMSSVQVKLNLGDHFSAPIHWPYEDGKGWDQTEFSDTQKILNLAFESNIGVNVLRLQDVGTNTYGAGGGSSVVSAGVGATYSTTRTVVDMLDLNGDGLPDMVMRRPDDSNIIRVKLNNGHGFEAENAWPMGNWSGLDSPLYNFMGGSGSSVLSFQRATGFAGSAGGKACYIICLGASGFYNREDAYDALDFEDIDGDGQLDQVLKNHESPTVQVMLNRIGPANLLKTVTRPLGTQIDLQYQRYGNTGSPTSATPRVDMPFGRWALSKVTVSDDEGRRIPTPTTPTEPGHKFVQAITYGNAFYDRDEHEDYGFDRVTVTREEDGSILESKYFNQDYYRKGMLRESAEMDSARRLYIRKLALPCAYTSSGVACANEDSIIAGKPRQTGWYFSPAAFEETYWYEGTTTDPALAVKNTRQERSFDSLGNLVALIDRGEVATAADDVTWTTEYDTERAKQYIYVPSRVVGRNTSGQDLRERQATYDDRGALDTVTDTVKGGYSPDGVAYTGQVAGNPKATFKYGAYGELSWVVDPNGLRIDYDEYDDSYTYPGHTKDSFGYESRATYDRRFGALTESIDVNGQVMSIAYDDFGRPLRGFEPADQGSSTATISYEYAIQPGTTAATPAYAVTHHKDVQHPGNPLDVVTFADQFGRTIQTKKDHERDTGTTTESGMTVSGAIRYDSRGRVAQVGQPIFDKGAATAYVSVPLQYPTTTTYDVLSRPISVLAPNGTATTMEYGFDTLDARTYFVTKTTDANGKYTRSFTTARGSTAAVEQRNTIDGVLKTLVTRYAYNPLEELLTVTDAKSKVTTAGYDTLGRMIALDSPDAGRTEWRYDVGSNVGWKQTAALRAQSTTKAIRYAYTNGRLDQINYPDSVDVYYYYGAADEAGAAKGNLAGRIKRETSEVGTHTMKYDRLGNVAEDSYAYHRVSQPSLGDYPTHTFRYDYDGFGRLLKLYFPGTGAEVVSFGYDQGGNLRSAQGENTQTNPQHPDEPKYTNYYNHIGYDEFGARTRFVYGNGIETTYQYDPAMRRLAEVNNQHRDPPLVQQGKPARPMQRLRYGYDLVGNITTVQNIAPYDEQMNASALVAKATQSYDYDDLYQITTAKGEYQERNDWRYTYNLTQSYDEIGNIKQKAQNSFREVPDSGGWRTDHPIIEQTYQMSFSYDSSRPHAPTHVDDLRAGQSTPWHLDITYDASGNTSRRAEPNAQPSQRDITWDEDNRVKTVKDNNQVISTVRLDAHGNRALNLTNSSNNEDVYFNEFFTLRNGAYPTKHVFAGTTRVASKGDADWLQKPVTLYYHHDHLGSTQYVTDDVQQIMQHDEYFPSGERWADETDSRNEYWKSYMFTGKPLDLATGLYYFGARYYEPRTGIWMSPDPILAAYMGGAPNGGMFEPRNSATYSYAWNSPMGLLDRDGLVVIGLGNNEGLYNRGEYFTVYEPRGDVSAMDWGVKIHISATKANAQRIAGRVLPYLVSLDVRHKFIADTDNVDSGAGEELMQSRKFITVYPVSTEQGLQLARALDGLTSGIAGAPEVGGGDVSWSGHVSLRYGAFTSDDNGRDAPDQEKIDAFVRGLNVYSKKRELQPEVGVWTEVTLGSMPEPVQHAQPQRRPKPSCCTIL